MRPGFSALELLIAMALAVVLAALAMPPMQDMLRRQHLRAAVSDLVAAIDLTRSQAIARSSRVMMVPLEGAGLDWSEGWVVFIDTNADRRPGPGEEVIASHGPLAEELLVSATFTGNRAPYYIAFNASGRGCSDTSSLAARWGTLSLYQGSHIRRIRINMLGRVRVCDPAVDGDSCAGPERGG
jgi:type IV fimbrial biogenesis protein FimT